MDCQRTKKMLVDGFDTHADPIATFCEQMIPHHCNAVNMPKLLLAYATPTQLDNVMWTRAPCMMCLWYVLHGWRLGACG
eukprot:m.33185 g.33185  ORF g.33185 m.33185 type:complete len:79 (+) comp14213_c0_seq1:1658-1894(+)